MSGPAVVNSRGRRAIAWGGQSRAHTESGPKASDRPHSTSPGLAEALVPWEIGSCRSLMSCGAEQEAQSVVVDNPSADNTHNVV